MRVIIAGGGTGGLAAAIALRKAGLEPRAAKYGEPYYCGHRADSDPWLNRIALTQWAACYIQDTDPAQPLV